MSGSSIRYAAPNKMPKEKSKTSPAKEIQKQQIRASNIVSSSFNEDINPTTLRPFNDLDPEPPIQIQFDWDTSYLKRMIGLDTDIEDLKRIWKQLQNENNCSRSDPIKPCMTGPNEKLKTEMRSSSSKEKLAKNNKNTKNVTKTQIKKHSCVNVQPETITKVPPKNKRPIVAKPLKFEEVHPNLKLISTSGSTLFPRRVQERSTTRTSRTDPQEGRHRKLSQNKVCTWHDMLQQCIVEDMGKLRKSDISQKEGIAEKKIDNENHVSAKPKKESR